MKKYIAPEIEITRINTVEDILSTSPGNDPYGEDKNWDEIGISL